MQCIFVFLLANINGWPQQNANPNVPFIIEKTVCKSRNCQFWGCQYNSMSVYSRNALKQNVICTISYIFCWNWMCVCLFGALQCFTCIYQWCIKQLNVGKGAHANPMHLYNKAKWSKCFFTGCHFPVEKIIGVWCGALHRAKPKWQVYVPNAFWVSGMNVSAPRHRLCVDVWCVCEWLTYTLLGLFEISIWMGPVRHRWWSVICRQTDIN